MIKDYLWIIVAGIFALVAFFLFIMTLSTSSGLIRKLKKKKANILINLTILLIGIVNIGIGIYLLMDIRAQIQMFTSL